MKDQIAVSDMSGQPEFSRFVFSHCQIGELFKIYIPNLIFTVLTLGIYRFWAKTRIRRYVFSHVKVMGDGFEYTGTAGELFKGFLLVMLVIILPFGILPALFAESLGLANQELAAVIYIVQTVFFACLFPIAIIRTYKYLFSRVNWRGVRFAQVAPTFGYWWRWMAFAVAMPVTLGLIYPFKQAVMTRYLVNHTRFGNQSCHVEISLKKLYGAFLISYVFCVLSVAAVGFGTWVILEMVDVAYPVGESMLADVYRTLVFMAAGILGSILLGLSVFYYYAKFISYVGSSLTLGECRFKVAVKPSHLLGFYLMNMLLMAMMFGFSFPVIMYRYLEFISRHFQASGLEALEQTIQVDREELKTGEGLADALDVGVF
ncbi:YjgN family protein [Terasakiella pusilla]|uniref:YjgN family protein n=1 Tax=Terasakiella pusilla TaxID=64973 RepID=UPI000491DDF5|nr:DUF898 family protein [Terasakiella pusilla]